MMENNSQMISFISFIMFKYLFFSSFLFFSVWKYGVYKVRKFSDANMSMVNDIYLPFIPSLR